METEADKIIEIVSDTLKIDILEKTRKREYSDGRKIASMLLRDYTLSSMEIIGIKLGNYNHSTIVHNIKKASYLLEYDKIFKSKFKLCKVEVEKKFSKKIRDYEDVRKHMKYLQNS